MRVDLDIGSFGGEARAVGGRAVLLILYGTRCLLSVQLFIK